MKEFFSSGKFKILLALFSLMFGLMIYAAVSAGAATLPEVIIGAVTKPFLQLSSSVSSGVENILDKFINNDKYYKENLILREQLSEMYRQIIDYEELKKQNNDLRDILKLKEENPSMYFSPPCDIIARNPNDVFGGFTINKGSYDEIDLYDPVFTSIGLVGRIVEVAPTYSRVSTIFSTEVKIGVYSARSKVTGVIENNIKYSLDNKCLMTDIPIESDLKEGDVIITTGQSGFFPAGLIIGTVERVEITEGGLSMFAIVNPAERIDKINTVFVITDFLGQKIDY